MKSLVINFQIALKTIAVVVNKDAPDYSVLERMSRSDLAIEYCERICASAMKNKDKDQGHYV